MNKKSDKLAVIIAALFMAISSQSVSAKDDFSKWKKDYHNSFQEYKDKRDKDFTLFLKTQWIEMDLVRGIERDNQPKPVVMPIAKQQLLEPAQDKPEDKLSESHKPVIKNAKTPVLEWVKAPEPKDKLPEPTKRVVKLGNVPVLEWAKAPELIDKKMELPKPVVKVTNIPQLIPHIVARPVVPAESEKVRNGRKIILSYLGGQHTFYYDSKLQAVVYQRIDKKAISEFWSELSLANYGELIEQINEKSKLLQLNDWAYALLVHDISKIIYPSSESGQSLFTWFVLAKAGYQSRIAYNDNEVFLLVPSQQPLYAVPFFTFDDVRYYAVRFDGNNQSLGQVYTYDGNYPDSNKALNMLISNEILVDGNVARRNLSFDYEGKHYIIQAAYDSERITFMETYPQLDLEWYFRGKVSSVSSNNLQQQLSNYMHAMDEQQAVNFLLRFVQTSLEYKTDEVQFGKENYLFPEETLYYPYSDCEDRSIFFSWLVHNLLGLDVVGLNYPGHVATAVRFKSTVSGDAVMHKGKRYLVADPTYINASVGMAMPNLKNKKPGVINIY